MSERHGDKGSRQPTPRTDALEAEDWLDGGPSGRNDWAASEHYVRKALDFARQLERELSEVRHMAMEYRADAQAWADKAAALEVAAPATPHCTATDRACDQGCVDALQCSRLAAPPSSNDVAPPAHNDHPMRHFDRTCPACTEPNLASVKSHSAQDIRQAVANLRAVSGTSPTLVTSLEVIEAALSARVLPTEEDRALWSDLVVRINEFGLHPDLTDSDLRTNLPPILEDCRGVLLRMLRASSPTDGSGATDEKPGP